MLDLVISASNENALAFVKIEKSPLQLLSSMLQSNRHDDILLHILRICGVVICIDDVRQDISVTVPTLVNTCVNNILSHHQTKDVIYTAALNCLVSSYMISCIISYGSVNICILS